MLYEAKHIGVAAQNVKTLLAPEWATGFISSVPIPPFFFCSEVILIVVKNIAFVSLCCWHEVGLAYKQIC